jgi:hypothetical protein
MNFGSIVIIKGIALAVVSFLVVLVVGSEIRHPKLLFSTRGTAPGRIKSSGLKKLLFGSRKFKLCVTLNAGNKLAFHLLTLEIRNFKFRF